MRSTQLILIIDDEELDLTAMQMILEAAGYNVVTSQSGAKALELARALDPDLLIVDLLMPPPDGFEICRRLDEAEGFRRIPRIVVTALSEKMHKTTTSIDVRSRVDADDYMEKPLDPGVLVARVGEILQADRPAADAHKEEDVD